MAQYNVGDAVRVTRTEKARQDAVDFLSDILGIDDKEVVPFRNSPVIGDEGVVVGLDPDDDDLFEIEFDREIGPITGQRTATNRWWLTADELSGVEVEQAA